MKKTVKYMLYAVCVAFLTSCGDMNSIHQEYLDRGETVYIARVDSIQSVSGLNRVQFKWWLKGDPRIAKVEITWTEGVELKSRMVDVNRTQSGALVMETVLENIPEGTYYFEFTAWDNSENRSVSLGKTVGILGSRYLEAFHNRTVSSVVCTDDGLLTVKWDSNPSYGVGCYLSYTSTANQPVSLFIPVDESSTTIFDWKSGLSYYTRFVPEELPLDTMSTEPVSPAIRRSEPFNGPHILSASAVCEIEARDFDIGGEGLGFHDVSNRTPNSSYRTAAGDYGSAAVDIEGGGNLGYVAAGEWLVYTVEVQDAGVYAVDVRLSANNSAGGSFYFSFDGERCDTQITPNQGNWSNWIYVFEAHPEFIPRTFRLSAGTHRFRFTVEPGGFNLMGYKFTYVGE